MLEVGLDGGQLAEEPGEVVVEQTDERDEAVAPVGEAGTPEHAAHAQVRLAHVHVREQADVGVKLLETDLLRVLQKKEEDRYINKCKFL